MRECQYFADLLKGKSCASLETLASISERAMNLPLGFLSFGEIEWFCQDLSPRELNPAAPKGEHRGAGASLSDSKAKLRTSFRFCKCYESEAYLLMPVCRGLFV